MERFREWRARRRLRVKVGERVMEDRGYAGVVKRRDDNGYLLVAWEGVAATVLHESKVVRAGATGEGS